MIRCSRSSLSADGLDRQRTHWGGILAAPAFLSLGHPAQPSPKPSSEGRCRRDLLTLRRHTCRRRQPRSPNRLRPGVGTRGRLEARLTIERCAASSRLLHRSWHSSPVPSCSRCWSVRTAAGSCLVKEVRVVQRPSRLSAFEFAVLAGLRAGQLARGCTPRVSGSDKVTVTAQMEVAEGRVAPAPGVVVNGRSLVNHLE